MSRPASTEEHERSGAAPPLRSFGWRPAPPAVGGVVGLAEKLPRPAAHLVAATLLLLVAALDFWTGPFVSASIFYLVPVSLVAWRIGRAAGVVWAVLCAAVWLVVDIASGEYPALPVEAWNATVRLGFFLIVAMALSQIRRLWHTARVMAGTDHLTGVLNGRAFYELIDLERSRTLRYDRPFTLGYMDVDGFKQVNDRYGHLRGDQVLRRIADVVRENIRSMDSVARLGGDEFGLLFPETGTGAAEVALGKIQTQLAADPEFAELGLTVSIGAVICVGPPESVDRLIHRADALMYAVKQGGRNGLRTAVLDENFGIEAILRRS